MKHKRKTNKLETMDLRIYIIPLLLISGIFIVSGFFLLSGIRNHFYDQRREEAVKLARSYAQSISRFSEAEELIDDLLSEKISLSTQSVALYDRRYSNEKLKDLASRLKVDEIDYYDQSGYLRYSNLENLIGWEIYEGHPIDYFLKSGKQSLVEGIRRDAITGDYYKYGYYKMDDGGLIQVGLRANTVYALLDRFSVNNLLLELKNNEFALHIDLLDQNMNIIGSTGGHLSEALPSLEEAKEALEQNREYSFINEESEYRDFKVIVPINLENEVEEDMHALSIAYSLEETTEQIRDVSFFSLAALSLIYGSILYSMRATYNKNESLRSAAYYHELTGLPNKLYLENFMESDLENRNQRSRGLILLRISNLNSINLTYGYHFGDQVLMAIPEKLREFEASGTKLFHFTADQFLIYKEKLEGEIDLRVLSENITASFERPFSVDGIDIYLSVKIGMVLVDESYDNANSIVKDASVALEQTFKEETDVILYDEKMYQSLQREDILVKEMRRAIEEKDEDVLFLEYQPIIDTRTKKIIAFEALGRMNASLFGRVSPLEFIEAAEKNLIMVELGGYFMDLAMRFIKDLENSGYIDLRIHVNVSGIQLLQSRFNQEIREKIEQSGIRPSQLEIEITESVLIDNLDMINKKFRELRNMGVKISLDDFGTGYSSFVRLHELLIDTLKIDRQFIQKLENSNRDLIIGDIIKMAHRYGLHVVAEGIEEEMQREFLLQHQCDSLQGFLFSPAVCREKAFLLLENEKR
ncbi:EAL domain-containing protein [Proteiniclasticum sp. SCR006]|uniref:EAL domain-containing protein n=1 Tax=Proteiniclasticum aestuarii TaxID=2817862 RepID=A0A939KGZ1_9CLOT|nr:GGDEF domain-containing phosphodiesterase [Proteiniclasticum aestuarii]MBO1266037.1 EAL domain-containing protein [Proteiniclasticum aestuarii]